MEGGAVYIYRNRNNGDEVTYLRPRPRLDRLANWDLISEPDSEGPVAARPGKGESKTAWAHYIASATDLSEAEAHDLTKAELVALADEQ